MKSQRVNYWSKLLWNICIDWQSRYEMKSMLPIELVAIQRFVDEMEGWVE